MNVAELLVPALRWDAERGFEPARALVERALELRVGGFILFGGPAEEVARLTAELIERSSHPLLIGADLERGAGQQFAGKAGLPPLAALGSLQSVEVMRKAGALTAREARELGINWVYAPSLDLDIEPLNPIIGTRAIGSDAAAVAELGAAWIEGCQSERALACAKHFPGHGRTTTDSHAELPMVDASAEILQATDLLPFSTAVQRGVASIMSAHVAYPALGTGTAPATLSPSVLRDLLRDRLGFTGLIVTDALIMAGVLQGETEARASVRALAAGCDMLLYPSDIDAVMQEVELALDDGRLDRGELSKSLKRRREWALWTAHGSTDGSVEEGSWAERVACRVVHAVRGEAARVEGVARVTIIDDDVGGPYPPPSREPFVRRLRELGVDAAVGAAAASPEPNALHIVALFGDIRAWKGRPGYSARALEELRSALGNGTRTIVVQFSHPRLAVSIPGGGPVVCAWGGEAVMQRAAAEWLVTRCGSN